MLHFPERLRFPCGSDAAHGSPDVRRTLILIVCLVGTDSTLLVVINFLDICLITVTY